MICKDKFTYTRDACHYPAKYLVIAPAAPKVVCGYHARAFLKGALIPLELVSPNINIDQLPDINGFLEAMKKLGAQVSIKDVRISISLGGEVHGKEDKRSETER